MAPQFTGKSFNLVDAKYWINEVEKALTVGEIPKAMKVSLVSFS